MAEVVQQDRQLDQASLLPPNQADAAHSPHVYKVVQLFCSKVHMPVVICHKQLRNFWSLQTFSCGTCTFQKAFEGVQC